MSDPTDAIAGRKPPANEPLTPDAITEMLNAMTDDDRADISRIAAEQGMTPADVMQMIRDLPDLIGDFMGSVPKMVPIFDAMNRYAGSVVARHSIDPDTDLIVVRVTSAAMKDEVIAGIRSAQKMNPKLSAGNVPFLIVADDAMKLNVVERPIAGMMEHQIGSVVRDLARLRESFDGADEAIDEGHHDASTVIERLTEVIDVADGKVAAVVKGLEGVQADLRRVMLRCFDVYPNGVPKMIRFVDQSIGVFVGSVDACISRFREVIGREPPFDREQASQMGLTAVKVRPDGSGVDGEIMIPDNLPDFEQHSIVFLTVMNLIVRESGRIGKPIPLNPDHPAYRSACLNGFIAFAKMGMVRGIDPAAFAKWVEHQKEIEAITATQQPAPPDTPPGAGEDTTDSAVPPDVLTSIEAAADHIDRWFIDFAAGHVAPTIAFKIVSVSAHPPFVTAKYHNGSTKAITPDTFPALRDSVLMNEGFEPAAVGLDPAAEHDIETRLIQLLNMMRGSFEVPFQASLLFNPLTFNDPDAGTDRMWSAMVTSPMKQTRGPDDATFKGFGATPREAFISLCRDLTASIVTVPVFAGSQYEALTGGIRLTTDTTDRTPEAVEAARLIDGVLPPHEDGTLRRADEGVQTLIDLNVRSRDAITRLKAALMKLLAMAASRTIPDPLHEGFDPFISEAMEIDPDNLTDGEGITMKTIVHRLREQQIQESGVSTLHQTRAEIMKHAIEAFLKAADSAAASLADMHLLTKAIDLNNRIEGQIGAMAGDDEDVRFVAPDMVEATFIDEE